MSFRFAFKTSFRHLQDVVARCLFCLGKASLRHLADVFLPTGIVATNKGHKRKRQVSESEADDVAISTATDKSGKRRQKW